MGLARIAHRYRLFLGRALLALLSACAGERASSPQVPSTLTILSGNSQTDTIDAALRESLAVRVTAATGAAVSMVPIVWGAEGGYTHPESTVTDASGIARSRWILGPQLGLARVIVGAPGVVLTDTFTATVQPGRAVRIFVVRQGTAWIVPPDSLWITASVRDRLANTPPNPMIQWSSSDPLVVSASSAGSAHPSGAPGEVYGIVHAVGPGRAYVAARSDNVSDSVEVIVVRDTALYGGYDLERRDSVAYPYCEYPSAIEVDCFSGSLTVDGVGGFVAKTFVLVTLIPLNQTLTDSSVTTGTYQPMSTCELRLVASSEPTGRALKSGPSLTITTDSTAAAPHTWVYGGLTHPQTCP